MRPTSVTVSSVAASAWIPVNYRQDNFNLGIQVSGSGTNTWKLEYTLDNIFDSAVTPTAVTLAAPFETGAGATAEIGNLTIPCRAIRLNVTAYTSGSATLTVLQGG